jgi:hypothetical protein
MITIAVRVKRRNLLAVLAAAVLVMAGAIIWKGAPAAAQVFWHKTAEVRCANAEEAAAWLREQGWEVDSQPAGEMEVVIPVEFDGVYESYNDIQKSQGFDLSRYKGETAVKYTFLVKNYPQEANGVAANLLVHNGKLIAADLSSLELGGFLKGVKAG